MKQSKAFNKRTFCTLFQKDYDAINAKVREILDKNKKEFAQTVTSLLKNSSVEKYYKSTVFRSLECVYYFKKDEANRMINDQIVYSLENETRSKFLEFVKGHESEKWFIYFKYIFEMDKNDFKPAIVEDNSSEIIEFEDKNGELIQLLNILKPIKSHVKYEKYSKESKAYANFIHEMIVKVVSREDEAMAKMILDYLSLIVKGKKADIAPYLYSPNFHQGIGKSSLIKLICALIGDENVCFTSIDVLESRFNLSLFGSRVVVLDDFAVKKGKENSIMDKLKAMITGSFVSYEGKCSNTFQGKCINTFLITTNNTLPAECEGGRRFPVYNVNPIWKNDNDKWNYFYQGLDNKEFVSYLFYELLNRKTDDRLQPQYTIMEKFIENRKQIIPAVYRYIAEKILFSHLLFDGKEEIRYPVTEFKCKYDSYMKEKGLYAQNSTGLNELLKDIGITSVKNSVMKYVINKRIVIGKFIELSVFTEDKLSEYGYEADKEAETDRFDEFDEKCNVVHKPYPEQCETVKKKKLYLSNMTDVVFRCDI